MKALLTALAVLISLAALSPAEAAKKRRHSPKPVQAVERVDPLWAALHAVSAEDLVYAVALAEAAGTPSAKVRGQCYAAWLGLLAPSQGAATGIAAIQGGSRAAAFESTAQVADHLQPDSGFVASCGQVATATRMTLRQFVQHLSGRSLGLSQVARSL